MFLIQNSFYILIYTKAKNLFEFFARMCSTAQRARRTAGTWRPPRFRCEHPTDCTDSWSSFVTDAAPQVRGHGNVQHLGVAELEVGHDLHELPNSLPSAQTRVARLLSANGRAKAALGAWVSGWVCVVGCAGVVFV